MSVKQEILVAVGVGVLVGVLVGIGVLVFVGVKVAVFSGLDSLSGEPQLERMTRRKTTRSVSKHRLCMGLFYNRFTVLV